MEELGITQIAALSPQAKGRIERLWRTFQDPLNSELRLARAATLEEAAMVLDLFVADFNIAFAVAPAETGSAFRKLDRRLNLDRVFSLRYTRVVANDHTISFGPVTIQLPSSNGKGYPGTTVDLCHQPDGTLSIYLGQMLLHQCHVTEADGAVRTRDTQRSSSKKQKQPRIYTLGRQTGGRSQALTGNPIPPHPRVVRLKRKRALLESNPPRNSRMQTHRNDDPGDVSDLPNRIDRSAHCCPVTVRSRLRNSGVI